MDRFKKLTSIPIRNVVDTDLTPVAKISKFFYLPLIAANKNYIAYTTSKAGIIRVIDQENADHIALSCEEAGVGQSIQVIDLKEISTTESILVASGNDIVLWKFSSDKDLDQHTEPINLTAKKPLTSREARGPVKIWHTAGSNASSSSSTSSSPSSSTKIVYATNDSESSTSTILVTDLKGNSIADVTLNGVLVNDLGFGTSSSTKLLILSTSGEVFSYDLSAPQQGVTVESSASRFEGTNPISVSLINRSLALVVGVNMIQVSDIDNTGSAPYGLDFSESASTKFIQAVYLAPYLFLLDKKEGLSSIVVAKLAPSTLEHQSLEFEDVTRLVFDIELHGFTVTKNDTDHTKLLFDVYVIGAKGVHIYTTDASGLMKPSGDANNGSKPEAVENNGDKPEVTPTNGTTANGTTKCTSTPPVLVSVTNIPDVTPVPITAPSPAPAAPKASNVNSRTNSTPKRSGTHHSPAPETPVALKTTNNQLLESYSHSDFKEKKYSLNEVIASGLFVTRKEHSQLQKQVLKLEQKLASLEKNCMASFAALNETTKNTTVPVSEPKRPSPAKSSQHVSQPTGQPTSQVAKENDTPTTRNRSPVAAEPKAKSSTKHQRTKATESPSTFDRDVIVKASSFEDHVSDMVSAYQGSPDKLDALIKKFVENLDIDLEYMSDTKDSAHRDYVYLSAVACLVSASTITEPLNKWIAKLLSGMSLDSPKLYEDSGEFVLQILKTAMTKYEKNCDQVSSAVMIKFNYVKTIVSSHSR